MVHDANAVEATVAAIETAFPGVCNVVDDALAPVAEWVPEVARVLGTIGRCARVGWSGGWPPGRPVLCS